jgi:hypothetical protein
MTLRVNRAVGCHRFDEHQPVMLRHEEDNVGEFSVRVEYQPKILERLLVV